MKIVVSGFIKLHIIPFAINKDIKFADLILSVKQTFSLPSDKEIIIATVNDTRIKSIEELKDRDYIIYLIYFHIAKKSER
jgi:hypothetical protein